MEIFEHQVVPLLSFVTTKNLRVHVVILVSNIFPMSYILPLNKFCKRIMFILNLVNNDNISFIGKVTNYLPVTNSRSSSAWSSLSLFRTGFAYPEFFQSLHFTWRVITHFLHFSTIGDKSDSINGNGSFCDISCNNALFNTFRCIVKYLEKAKLFFDVLL